MFFFDEIKRFSPFVSSCLIRLWMTVKPVAPKYGKFSNTILESDITIFLVEMDSGRLVSFSDVDVEDEKRGVLVDVDVGVYKIIFFTSGIPYSLQFSSP